MTRQETFKARLEQHILDPAGTHHEFAYGTHGQKLDFDLIDRESSLYRQWVDTTAVQVKSIYPRLPFAVLGIANGTNRLAEDVATTLGIAALYTHKVSPREVALTEASRILLSGAPQPDVLGLEDVGTSGGTAHSGLRSAKEANAASNVAVLFTWQRQAILEVFTSSDIPYHAVIHEPLPTYAPEQCLTEGFCAQGWELIPHGANSS